MARSASRRLLTSICLLAGLVAVAAPRPAMAAETGFVPALGQNVDGPQKAADLGVGWVRLFLNWRDAQPAADAFNTAYVNAFAREVSAYRAAGVKVLVVATGSPSWASGSAGGIGAPIDPAHYAAFVDRMMLAAPAVGAWEIWNEADANLFWENGPQPAAYAALLRTTYPVIKARDRTAIVVSTGMVGNDADFLQDLYDNAAKGSFDAVGVHTDTPCLIATPDFVYRETDGRIGRYAFTGYREVHHVMARNGDGAKPIWMTEIGWNTSSTEPNSCRDGAGAGAKPAGVTQAQQAKYLEDAYCLAADPFVTVALWFSLQDTPSRPNYDGHLGLLRADGSAKPAYAAMKALRNGTRATPDMTCGGVLDHAAPDLRVERPSDGLRFSDRLSLRAVAADAPGGTGVSHVELFADGKRVVKVAGPALTLDPWFGARDRLGLGAHTLTFVARDGAGNAAQRVVHVEKVLPSQLPRLQTRLTLRARARPGRRVTLRGRHTHAATELPPGGRVYVSVERLSGGRYRRVKLVSAKPGRSFAITVRLPAGGRYRALARYRGAAPFDPARSPYRRFTARP